MTKKISSLLCGCFALFALPAMVVAEPVVWRDPLSGIEFVRIDAGCFEMGEQAVGTAEPGFPNALPDELPRHRVCVDGFWLGRTEITQAQWQRVMGGRSGRLFQSDQAVSDVSWLEAQQFVGRLSAMAGETPAEKRLFRLPTEAEWEYACHAGDRKPVFSGDIEALGHFYKILGEDAWYKFPDFPDRFAHPVAQKKANAWGLHDMLGNVFEWVADSYRADAYSRHGERNPGVFEPGEQKLIRGGSYKTDIAGVRCGARNHVVSGERLPHLGLRVVMKQ